MSEEGVTCNGETDPQEGEPTVPSADDPTTNKDVLYPPGHPLAAFSPTNKLETTVAKKRKGKRAKVKPPPLDVQVFRGTFIHSTPSDPVKILKDWVIGVRQEKITFFIPARYLNETLIEHGLDKWKDKIVTILPDGTFMIPGFIDGHAHAFPYLVLGTDVDGRSPRTVNGYQNRKQSKMTLIHQDSVAKKVIHNAVVRSLWNGVTCAAYYGTKVESAARLLADTLARNRQRSLVGLEVYCSETREDIHLLQVNKAEDVIQHINKLKSPLVTPYLISSHPLPGWIDEKVQDLQQKYEVRFKTAVGDICAEDMRRPPPSWVDVGESVIKYRQKADMISDKTILVQGNGVSVKDRKVIKECGASVVHCPSTDIRYVDSFCPVRGLLEDGIAVALGTDMLNGRSLSILEAMRRSIEMSKLRSAVHDLKVKLKVSSVSIPSRETTGEGEGAKEEEPEQEPRPEPEPEPEEDYTTLSYKEVFKMATLGGATALGLEHCVGNFEPGKDFDALLIDPHFTGSGFDVFPPHDDAEDIFEKFLFLGDDRNIIQVFVAGQRVK